MYIVHVHVSVKQEFIEGFKQASVKNAQASIKEPGIARFDVIQALDDPTKFILVEVYRQKEDALKHKETDHYKEWRDTAAEMMAEPRKGIKYENIFPLSDTW